MAYERTNTLISRSGYSGVGDWWDTVSGAAGSVLKFWGAEQQAQGAAAATQQSNRDLLAALQAQQGIGTGTIVMLGGLGVAAFLLLRKRKSE